MWPTSESYGTGLLCSRLHKMYMTTNCALMPLDFSEYHNYEQHFSVSDVSFMGT